MKLHGFLLFSLAVVASVNVSAETRTTSNIRQLQVSTRIDPSSQLLSLQKRAEGGDVIAQYDLGTRYLKGDGVKQDDAAAFEWIRRAAEKNNAEAEFILAGMYDQGRAVAQDYQAAAEWNFKAAEQGHAGALYNLGMLYSTGDGVPRDVIKAHMWFNLAAAKGNPAGADGRKRCEEKMSQWQLGQAQALAREWQAKYR